MKLTFDVPEEMAEKIAEDIKAALDEHKKKQAWPQKGDKYWYIRYDNTIDCTVWDNMIEEFQMLEIGNAFRTQEEAEFKTEQLKVLHELEELADDDQPWDQHHFHYAICYFHGTNEIITEALLDFQNIPNIYSFKTRQSAQAAIDKIGKNRLKKYYFGAKDVV